MQQSLDFLVGQAVARRHLDLAAGQLGTAGGADAGLAGERRRKSRRSGAVEDILFGELDPSGAAVESYRHCHACRFRLQLSHFRGERR